MHNRIVYSREFGQINAPIFHDCVVHLICSSGSGSFAYNGRQFTLSVNDIAVISQPKMVEDIQCDAAFECEYIAAPAKLLHNLLPANNYSIIGGVSLYENPIIKVSAADALRFAADLSNIRRRAADTEHCFYQELMGSVLQTMVYDLFDFHAKTSESILTTDRVGYITTRFFAMIEAGVPKTHREVSYYARQLNVSPKYLSDTIKRVSGASVSTHINNAATAIALHYLKNSQLSVSQIADEMNFSSLSYFSRFCLKHTGMTPLRCRSYGIKKAVQ